MYVYLVEELLVLLRDDSRVHKVSNAPLALKDKDPDQGQEKKGSEAGEQRIRHLHDFSKLL